ncbi:MAG: cell wall-binding repeat-containing protein, partial [Nakamurella sp.]
DDVTFAGTTTNFEPDPSAGGDTGGGGTGGGGAGDTGGAGTAPGGIQVLGATDRISGANRYETSSLIADVFGTANAVVIANGSNAKNGVDALAANYLAGRVAAPILLTEATTVPATVLASVKSVLTGSANPTIYVMGKSDAVSDAVVSAIKAAAASVSTGTVTVVRVAGNNRYETSAKAAEQAGEVQAVKTSSTRAAAKTAILTSGGVNADALSAGPISYSMGVPVLLTNGASVDATVVAAIHKLGITQLLVLGGPDRVSQAALSATGIAADHTVRIAGVNRFATSADLYTFALQTMGYHGGDDTDTYLGNALGGFPDVLSSGPLAGKAGAAVLTVGQGNSLDLAVQAYLRKHSTANITALGGPDRVSAEQLTEARKLANE